MNKKEKIFFIANTSNFFNVFMLNHINYLSKNYHLFICCNNANKLKNKIPNNVSLIDLRFKRGLSLFHDTISFILTLFFFLKNRPNLSISFTPKIGFIVALATFIARTPYRIHWFTGQIWATRRGFKRIFYKSIDRLIFSSCDHVFVDGISQRKFLMKEKVISKDKSTVFHKGSVGGVNISKFKFNKKIRSKFRKKYSVSSNTFIFLYLGRINKDKGIVELINAFKEIQNQHNVLLVFVGQLEDKKLNNYLNKNKKILHFKFSSKPEEWFSFADIICLPSHREGFGTVIIESASCGVPSLCSNIYGLKDAVIENQTGFFHKVGSKNDIKKKMLKIIKNKKLIKKYGRQAKIRVKKDFEQNIITKKLARFINFHIE